MKINILVNYVNGGWSPKSTRLGGTEEGVVRWADEMAKMGHEVTVFHNGDHGTYGDVDYEPREDYIGDCDITINVKSFEVDPIGPTVYLTNETDADMKDLSKFDAVIWPSEWAATHIPVNNHNIYILPYGCDTEKIYYDPSLKVPKRCLYASSPDRGLGTVYAAWPEIQLAHPDAELIVTYEDDITEEEMNDYYLTSDLWLHPASGGELYCITGYKAQRAGCVPVIFPTMALRETVKHGIFSEPGQFAYDVIGILNNSGARDKIRKELAEEDYISWEENAKMLIDILEEVLNG